MDVTVVCVQACDEHCRSTHVHLSELAHQCSSSRSSRDKSTCVCFRYDCPRTHHHASAVCDRNQRKGFGFSAIRTHLMSQRRCAQRRHLPDFKNGVAFLFSGCGRSRRKKNVTHRAMETIWRPFACQLADFRHCATNGGASGKGSSRLQRPRTWAGSPTVWGLLLGSMVCRALPSEPSGTNS